ncbi:MAG: response regulator transcription factor [Rhodospirillales bacterium]|jgi:two-component system nitrate/nitrite response regulator NarL
MRLLIADDHVLVRDALKSHIERVEPGAIVSTVGSVDEALVALDGGEPPDIVILDLLMPGTSGIDGIEKIKAKRPGLPVAIMSGNARPQDVNAAVAKGAAGFIPKTLNGGALVGAIHLMLGGETFLPASVHAMTAEQPAVRAEGGPPLTKRERQILEFLLKGSSNKEIARALELEEVTVKMHVRGVFRKLGARNRTQAAMRAVELGFES